MTLKNPSIQVKKGSFVCIIGEVGSGKSSLLSAIIGDMLHLHRDQAASLNAEEMNEAS